jgi:hypothetical protein
VLALEPDLVGLQEWYPRRWPILGRTGRVSLVPGLGLPAPRNATPYLWNVPLVGGCVIGARVDRFELLSCGTRLLSRPGFSDRELHHRTLEPGRVATVATYRDLLVGLTVCLVNFHLVSGVQADGSYRQDRPVLVKRHQHEVQALRAIVRDQQARGHVVHATGDSNFDGLRIDGLTSAWDGRDNHPGTLGPRRKVDDVHGPGQAEAVTLVETGSDHRAIVVRRPDAGDA